MFIALGLCALALRPRAEAQGALERTVSVTAELASSAFRKRLKAQSERPAKTIASSPYDSFNGSVESYRLRPCIGWRPLNSDGTLGPYTWLSYGDAQFEVLRISSGLHRKFGLARNSQVGAPSPQLLLYASISSSIIRYLISRGPLILSSRIK